MKFPRELGVGGALLLVWGGLAIVEPRMLSADTLGVLMLTVPLVLVGAIGQLMVITARHVDISTGSILGLAAVVSAFAFRDIEGFPVWAGFLLAIGVGAGAGLINGLLVTMLGLHSIIVTLATLGVFRGLAFVYSGGRQVSGYELPDGLLAMGQAGFAGLTQLALIAFGVAVLGHLVLQHTSFGRQLYATGSNPDAARLRGVRTGAVVIWGFVATGACAGLAGMMYAARFGVVNPSSVGVGFELDVIAAVIVGGVSIRGGEGSAAGVVLGVMLVSLIQVALPVLGLPRQYQDPLSGLIILAALVADRTLLRSLAGRVS